MDDPYAGFDEVDDFGSMNGFQSHSFQQAVARSSHGRRPISTTGVAPVSMTLPSSSAGRSSYGRIGTASVIKNEPARPMTAVRAAGYTSFANKIQANELATSSEVKTPENSEDKYVEMELKVIDVLKESVLLADKKMFKPALEKAKEAGRKERAVVKFREQQKMVETMNLDLTFVVLFNLAQQYLNNDMANEALNTYQLIVKNKMFPNSGRLKVNIANIHFKKKEYNKALKYYRMALDQIPSIQKETKIKILNNIGVCFIRIGKYDDALSTFEHCVEERADFSTGLNLAYCIDDADKMKDAFQRMLDIPISGDDELKSQEKEDVLLNQVLNNDSLRHWERSKRHYAERAILTAAKIISPAIANEFAIGYDWCVEAIKQSVHSPLATELEMGKAGDLLKRGDLEGAIEVLKAFHSQDSKIAIAAANNLAMLHLLKGNEKLKEAEEYSEQALQLDHYSANALVNAGNIAYFHGDPNKALHNYREALSNEASCVQALYNMGLIHHELGNLEQALDCFYKLHNILLNNVQVFCQLASIYESLEDTAQAIELYSQANSLAPTDPAILSKLASIYDAEGDKSQAFQCNYDSYRYFPSNIKIIEWLGAYYIETQFSEKALLYFEKASIMQPNEIKWQLMMASSQRRAGNYQKALDLYKNINRKFPENIECLKFLVRLCTDLGMPDAADFGEKLKKVERVNALRIQRESDSSHGKRHSANSAQSLPIPQNEYRPNSLQNRNASAQQEIVSADTTFSINQKDMKSNDFSYKDLFGPAPSRPKTGSVKKQREDSFEDFDDSLLPE
ncbi:unnamed protein product [Auanema sp. JU1783]|nr:unnamed protein product [Auanema sp. JU1783]